MGEFFLSKFGGGKNTSDATAKAQHLLEGYDAYGADGKFPGSMPNRGAVDKKLSAPGDSYTIPQGYHDGTGKVSVDMADNGAITKKLTKPSESYTVPKGFHDGDGTVAVEMADNGAVTKQLTLPGAAFSIPEGYHNGNGSVAVDMVNNGAVSKTLNASSTSYTIPEGYHNGEGKVSISTQTKTVTPTVSDQVVRPSSGKVLSAVTVQGVAVSPFSKCQMITYTPQNPHTSSFKIAHDLGVQPDGFFITLNEAGDRNSMGTYLGMWADKRIRTVTGYHYHDVFHIGVFSNEYILNDGTGYFTDEEFEEIMTDTDVTAVFVSSDEGRTTGLNTYTVFVYKY